MNIGIERGALLAAWIGTVALRPDLPQLRTTAADPSGAIADRGADVVIGDLAAVGLWLGCVWLALASAVVAGTRLPGLGGAFAQALARRVAPQVLRRTLALAVGVGIAATPALAAADPAPSPSVSVTWPLSTDPLSTDPNSLDPNSTTAPAAEPDPGLDSSADAGADADADASADGGPAAPHGQAPTATVLVQTGDTLWSIAAAGLGPTAGAADIAAAWPQWYLANAEAIGADPDLIRPGTTLQAPTSGEQR